MESRIIKLIECIESNKSSELSQIAAFQLGQLAKESGPEIFKNISHLFLSKNLEVLKFSSQTLSEILRNSEVSCPPAEWVARLSDLRNNEKALKKRLKQTEEPFSELLNQFRDYITQGDWEGKFGSLLGAKVLFKLKILCRDCEEDFASRVIVCVFSDHTADYSDDLAVFPLRKTGSEILASAREDIRRSIEEVILTMHQENLLGFLLIARKGKMFSHNVYKTVLQIIENICNEDVITEACHYLNKYPLEKDQKLADLIMNIIEKSDTLSGFIKYAIRILDKLFNTGCELPKNNPKIYQFFVHFLTEVRVATLSAYESLAKKGIPDYSTIFLLTMQLYLLETNKLVIERSYFLLKILITKYDLSAVISNYVKNWADFLLKKNQNDFSFFLKPDPLLSIEEQYSFTDNNTEEDIKSSAYTDKNFIERLWRVSRFLYKSNSQYSIDFLSSEPQDSFLSILSSSDSQVQFLYQIASKESEGKFDIIRQKFLAVYKIVKFLWTGKTPLPERITVLFQAVVTAYKHEPTDFLLAKIAKSASRLTFLLKSRGPNEKFIANLIKIRPFPLLQSLQEVHQAETPSIIFIYSDLLNPGCLSLVTEFIHPSLFDYFLSKIDLILIHLPNESLISSLCKIFTQIPLSIPVLIKATLTHLKSFPLPYVDLLKVLKNLLKNQIVSFIPYAACIVLPLLKHLNTEHGSQVSSVFSEILFAVMLDHESEIPDFLKPAKEEGLTFLANLKGMYSLPKYTPRIPLKNIELRDYQREGIAWMRFLAEFRLGGLLCDEMGLGKTIQSLCAVAEAHLDRPSATSLIVCPASVAGHWVYEANKYLNLAVHEYPNTGQGLCVTSYQHLTHYIEKYRHTNYLYVLIDEGHLLSNPKNKTFKSLKLINSELRLILTGTPIQNKILDIWPLFDFLMPGFLGTQNEFSSTYQKFLRSKKVSTEVKFRDEYQALQKLNSLHKKILPFVLRRLKKDMLNDLPEKIVQDYYVSITETQHQLISSKKALTNQIESLSYIEKVCNHPVLVNPDLDSEVSPKLEALKELLTDYEISEEAGACNKALVFSKSKKVLTLIENKVLFPFFPDSSFSRLDGKTPPAKRFELCQDFNNNIRVRLMLLTTKTGGLGLNLQSASIVIFFDHSWNPVADLQAMDRAHRIGQKKVLNVYRLITRGTLEEEILNLQAFKQKIAESLVNAENSSMKSVDSVNLLSSVSKLG